MTNQKVSVFNWSGGKDSSICLYKCLQDKSISIQCLLTTVNKHYDRISMHGVRSELLDIQAKHIGFELRKVYLPAKPSMESYEKLMGKELKHLESIGVEYSIFGDIFLQDLREYREKKLEKFGMKALFPLWDTSTIELVKEFIDLGFKSIVVCVNEKHLNKSFAGRIIDYNFLNDLPKNVDPCGENGEYHSFVYDGPIFKKPVEFELGDWEYRKYKYASQKSENKNNTDIDTAFWYRDIKSS